MFADRFNNLAENKALITNLKLADIHNIEFTTEAISKEVAIKQASEIVTYVQNENDTNSRKIAEAAFLSSQKGIPIYLDIK